MEKNIWRQEKNQQKTTQKTPKKQTKTINKKLQRDEQKKKPKENKKKLIMEVEARQKDYYKCADLCGTGCASFSSKTFSDNRCNPLCCDI